MYVCGGGVVRGLIKDRGGSGRVKVRKIGCSLPAQALDAKLRNLC